MGLKVDNVSSGGEGTFNDGNTSWRFFDDTQKVAEITGIKKFLLNVVQQFLKQFVNCPDCHLVMQ
jgi:hypothetical protein